MTPTATPASPARAAGVLAVELDDVVKRFGAVTAVDGVSPTIRPGEVVALLGPNGAGKTSTVELLLGLSRPTSGHVRVCGRAPHEAVALGLVSAVMQTGGLLSDYTVEETVRLTAALFGRSRAQAGQALQRAGLADVRGRLVGRCSGGQKQRLRFAMALLPDPELLILDEPTTGMDVAGRHDFWTAIRADAHRGCTVIFATHYPAPAPPRMGKACAACTAGRRRSVPGSRPAIARTNPDSGYGWRWRHDPAAAGRRPGPGTRRHGGAAGPRTGPAGGRRGGPR